MDNLIFISKKKIEEIVKADLNRYLWLSGQETLELPVNPSDVFRILFGLETIYIDFDSVGLCGCHQREVFGTLYTHEKKIFIHTGKIHEKGPLTSKVIQRFSIAHEGSHYSLHNHALYTRQLEFFSPKVFIKNDGNLSVLQQRTGRHQKYNPLESQANYYATSLLIPKDVLLETVSSSDVLDLQKWGRFLCEKFWISRQCLEYRLDEIGIRCKNTLYIEDSRQLVLLE